MVTNLSELFGRHNKNPKMFISKFRYEVDENPFEPPPPPEVSTEVLGNKRHAVASVNAKSMFLKA
jgi:hypothetical protein